jgi:cystathionine beta-lyase
MPDVAYWIPEGTYLAWLDISGAGWDDDAKFSDMLAEKTGVLVNPGHIFGPGGEGHIRLNVACPRARLVDALGKIKSVLPRQG